MRAILAALVCAALIVACTGAAFADDRADCSNSNTPADAAIAACGRLIAANELKGHELATIYCGRGFAYLRKEDRDRAIADFDQAVSLDSAFANAYRGRADARSQKGDLERALADYDEAIRLNPNFAAAHVNRGLIFERKGDLDRAIADESEAIRIDPRNAAAHNNRGYYLDRKGDRDGAIADLDEAIRLAPNYTRAWRNRGLAFEHKGNLDRAIADFDQAIKLEPTNASSFIERGNAWRNKHDYDKAMADYNEAIRLAPSNGAARRGRGWVYEDKKDLDNAIADYGAAIRLDPKDAIAHFRRAFLLRRKGAVDSALADYNEAIRLNPKDAFALNNRGSIWRAKGDVDRAIADLSEAVRLDSSFTSALANRGLAYESKGDRARAIADFKAAVTLPIKYDNGKWAHDTAQARLAVLAPANAPTAPAAAHPPPAAPTPPGPTVRPVAPANQPPASIVMPTSAKASRLALVIGNGGYRNAPALPNPANDARAIAKALRDAGFAVIEAADLDRTGMEKALLEFLQRAPLATVRLLFYAGHGIQIDGANYLVPVDARIANKTAAMFELIDIDRVLKGLDDEAHANVVILDACRDNPFETHLSSSRSTSRGAGLIGYEAVGSGTLIAFATAPGTTADDGEGAHSPFTTALLKHIGTPGIEVNQMLTRVRVDVAAATARKQIPWVNSSLLGDVYLGAPPKAK